METPEQSPYEDGALTLEKAKWVEEQVNRTLEFHIESFGLLSKAAETTLNWLFGIAVGASGYVASHLTDEPRWITIPLITATLLAGIAAFQLMIGAMLAEEVPSPGNVPKNIGSDKHLKTKEEWLRLLEARGLEGIITHYEVLNLRRGKAINRAREAVIIIPALTIIAMLALPHLL
jgi:hypothetical protein